MHLKEKLKLWEPVFKCHMRLAELSEKLIKISNAVEQNESINIKTLKKIGNQVEWWNKKCLREHRKYREKLIQAAIEESQEGKKIDDILQDIFSLENISEEDMAKC